MISLAVVLLFVFVKAEPCNNAATGTPCLCVTAGTEGDVGNTFDTCGATATFVGVTNSNKECVISGNPLCGTDGTISGANRCCHSCGSGALETALITSEQCDPVGGPVTGDCCLDNCQFVAGATPCEGNSNPCTVETCSGTSATCPSTGGTNAPSSTACTKVPPQSTNVCLDQFCDGAGVCGRPNTGNTCSNGADACPDTCVSGACPNNGVGCGGAAADPHITGPFGEKFEFHGQGGGVYNMFASRQIVVNAQMMNEGPDNHFMTKIGVRFANVTLHFDTINRPADYLRSMNALLEPVGAHATGDKYKTTLHLCDGQLVEISQKRSDGYYFLNVDVDAIGCHDEFNGVIGQLYKCAYTDGSFVWDPKNEESFRVASLYSTAGSFDSLAACYERHEYGTAFPSKKK